MDAAVEKAKANKQEIRNKMIEIAKQRLTIYYSELFKPYNLNFNNKDHYEAVYEILDDISEKEHESGRPLLSSVVVNVKERMPGDGFFDLEKIKQSGISKNSPLEDKKECFSRHKKETHDYWSQQLQNKP